MKLVFKSFTSMLSLTYCQSTTCRLILVFSSAHGYDGYNVPNKASQPNSENFLSNSRGGFGRGGNFNRSGRHGGGCSCGRRFANFQCQVCLKYGHVASHCHYRYDQLLKAALEQLGNQNFGRRRRLNTLIVICCPCHFCIWVSPLGQIQGSARSGIL